ncbi:MAG: galactokinase family protein [Fimbriimonadaceae bacterium]|nr:galactokinase family protein [Fimbriimonadaceae bacterium]
MTSSSPASVSNLIRAPESVEAVGSSARAQEEPLLRLLLERIDPEAPAAIFRVPGRIELFGKHTDYAGGRSITCASDRALVFLAQPSKEPGVRVFDRVRGKKS